MWNFINTPPEDLIDIKELLGKGDNAYKTCQELRECPKDKESKLKILSDCGNKKHAQAFLWWNQIVKDSQSLKKMIILPYLLQIKYQSKQQRRQEFELDQQYFTVADLFEVIQKTKDVEIAKMCLRLLFLRAGNLLDREYFLNQIIEPSAVQAEEGIRVNYDQSIVFQVLKQVKSRKFQVKSNEQQSDSAFDEEIQEFEQVFEEGPIPAPFLKDTKFFNSLIFWAQLVLRESRTHYFTALEIVRNMLDFQLLEINEKLVLPMTQINLLTLANVFGNLNQDSGDNYCQLFERIFTNWIGYLDKDIYWAPFANHTQLTLVTHNEKAEFIALLLHNMADSKQFGPPIETYGQTLLQGPIFDIFNEKILPKANEKAPNSVDKIITGYIILLSAIMDNEPGLISRLINEDLKKEDKHAGLLYRLFQALLVWNPQNSPTKILYEKYNLKALVDLICSISANREIGTEFVELYGPPALNVVLNARPQTMYMVQDLSDKSEQLNFKLGGNICRLLENKCLQNIQVLKDFITHKIEQAHIIADELVELNQKYLKQHSGNPVIATSVLSLNHQHKVSQLTGYLSILTQDSYIKERRGPRHYYEREEPICSYQALESVFCQKQDKNEGGSSNNNGPEKVEKMLKEREDLTSLILKLNNIQLNHQKGRLENLIVNMVMCQDSRLIREEAPHDPKNCKTIVENFKKALKDFDDVTFVSTCSTFEQLSQHYQENRDKFTNLKFWTLTKLLEQGKIGSLYDWSNEIKTLIHINRLRYRRILELAYQDFVDPEASITIKPPSFDLAKMRPETGNLKDYLEIARHFCKSKWDCMKYVDFYFSKPSKKSKETCFSYLLKTIFKESSFQNQMHHYGGDPQHLDKKHKNLVAIGENLADICQDLQHNKEKLSIEILLQNQAILQQIFEFRDAFKSLEALTLAFVQKGALEPLCKLYLSLQSTESLFKDHEKLKIEDHIYKCLISETTIQLQIIIQSLLKQSKRILIRADKFKQYTQDQYEDIAHYIMNAYAQVYNYLLNWEQPEEATQKLMQLKNSQEDSQDKLMNEILKSMQVESWQDSIKQQQNEQRNQRGYRGQQQQAQRVQAEPTEEQKLQLSELCGIDPEMSGSALRMAGLDMNRAAHIFFYEQDRLFEYIQKENEQKEKEKLEKLIRDSLPRTEQKKPPLSIDKFKQLRQEYRKQLFWQLVKAKQNTLVTRVQALELVNQYKLKEMLKGVNSTEKLMNQLAYSDIEHKPFVLQFIAVVLKQTQQWSAFDTNNLILFGQKQLEDSSVDIHYYLFVLMYQLSKICPQFQEQPNIIRLNKQFLKANSVQTQVKQLIMTTIYHYMQQYDCAQLLCQHYVFEFDQEKLMATEIYVQILKMAMHSEPTNQALFKHLTQQTFVTLHQYKLHLIKKQTAEISEDKELEEGTDEEKKLVVNGVYISLKDMLMLVNACTGNQIKIEKAKAMLLDQCEVIKLTKDGQFLCRPKFDLQNCIAHRKDELQSIKELRLKGYTEQSQNAIETYRKLVTSQERHVSSIVFKYIQEDSTLRSLERLAFLAQMTSVYPHLLSQFDLLDQSNFEAFTKILIERIQSNASDEKLLAVLCRILAPLTSVNDFSTPYEYAVRLTLKHTILKETASQLIVAIDSNQDNSKSLIGACLDILLCLTNQACKSQDENRVLVSEAHFADSVAFLLKETQVIQSLSLVYKQLISQNSGGSDYDLMQKVYLMVLVICSFLSEYQVADKKTNEKKKLQVVKEDNSQSEQEEEDIDDDDGNHSVDHELPVVDPVQEVAEQVQDEQSEEEEQDEEEKEDMDPDQILAQLEAEAEAQQIIGQSEHSSDEENMNIDFQNAFSQQQNRNDILQRPREEVEDDQLRRRLEEMRQIMEDIEDHDAYMRLDMLMRNDLHQMRQRRGPIKVKTSALWTHLEQQAQTLLHSLLSQDTFKLFGQQERDLDKNKFLEKYKILKIQKQLTQELQQNHKEFTKDKEKKLTNEFMRQVELGMGYGKGYEDQQAFRSEQQNAVNYYHEEQEQDRHEQRGGLNMFGQMLGGEQFIDQQAAAAERDRRFGFFDQQQVQQLGVDEKWAREQLEEICSTLKENNQVIDLVPKEPEKPKEPIQMSIQDMLKNSEIKMEPIQEQILEAAEPVPNQPAQQQQQQPAEVQLVEEQKEQPVVVVDVQQEVQNNPNQEQVVIDEEEDDGPHEILLQPEQEQQVAQADEQEAEEEKEEMFYGIPRSVLEAHDITPEILEELDEETREELLSSVAYEPPAQQQQVMQQEADLVANLEQAAQQILQQQNNQAENNDDGRPPDIAAEQWAQLPEAIRIELTQEYQRQQQAQQQPPGQNDYEIALAALSPGERAEALVAMSQEQIELLPEALRQEAQQARAQMEERAAQRQRRLQQEENYFRGGGYNHNRGGLERPSQTKQFLNKLVALDTQDKIEKFIMSPDELYFAFVNYGGEWQNENRVIVEAQKHEKELSDSGIVQHCLDQLNLLIQEKPDKQYNLVDVLSKISQIKDKDNQGLFHKQICDQILKQLAIKFQSVNKPKEVMINTSSSSSQEEEEVKQQNTEADQQVVQILVLLTTLRYLMKQDRKFAQYLLSDFLSVPDTTRILFNQLKDLNCQETVEVMSDVDEKQKTIQAALHRNLMCVFDDILRSYTDKSFSKIKQDPNIVALLCSFLQITNLKQSIEDSLAPILIRLSYESEKWDSLHSICSQNAKETQLKIAELLMQVVAMYGGSCDDLEIEKPAFELKRMSSIEERLSLKKKVSSSNSGQMKVQALAGDQLKQVISTILKTEDLLQKQQIYMRLYKTFNDTEYKTDYMVESLQKQEKVVEQGNQEQLEILNVVLSRLQNQTGLNSHTLIVLSKHLSAMFDLQWNELQAIIEQQKGTDAKMEINMMSMQKSQQNDKAIVSQQIFRREIDLSDKLFSLCTVCCSNRDFINKILGAVEESKESLKLKQQIYCMPNLLNFKRKQEYFKRELKKKQENNGYGQELRLNIDRDRIFEDTFSKINFLSKKDLSKPVHITYKDQSGIDAGGLKRDFFTCLSKSMFNPAYRLFFTSNNGVSKYPDADSAVNDNHLQYFKFIGKVIGMALLDSQLLEVFFNKPLYKMMVGDDLEYEDLQELDIELYRSFNQILKPQDYSVDVLGLTFGVDRSYFGKNKKFDLIQNGNDVEVTEENKTQYVEKYSLFVMYSSIKEQIDSFLSGFHEMIPKKLSSIFTATEMQMLISGMPKVDLDDMKKNSEYHGYSAASPQIKWMWQTLESFTDEQMGKFLQFVTGCSRVPLQGFAKLQGMSGDQKFQVHLVKNQENLPHGHTCFNQLDLPEYATFEILKYKLTFAIENDSGFGFG